MGSKSIRKNERMAKNKVKKGKIKNERKKIIEKHFLEDEFNGLTKYED